MDFDDTPSEAAWRLRVRTFVREHRSEMPRGVEQYNAEDEAELGPRKAWQRILYDAGFVGVGWPEHMGGRPGTPMQAAIVAQELSRAGSAPLINRIGLGMAGPTILTHGTATQQARYIKPLLRADEVWCQLFSEPSAGSDLAAVETRATLEDDATTWHLSGQKVWTSSARHSDFGIIVARSDDSLPKHRGLTYFVIDMHSPGITIRPLRQMSGDTGFNEVFFDDVAVPAENVVGEVNNGWRVVLTTLMNERLAIGGGGTDIGIGVNELVAEAAERIPELSPDRVALLLQDIGQAYIEALAVRLTGYRRLTAISRGAVPGPEASAGKLAGVASGRRIAEIGRRLLGVDAVWQDPPPGSAAWHHVSAVLQGLSIAGGTEQILKNVIGERVLGLPPDLRVDKSVPFRDVARDPLAEIRVL
jgi:alkylation response protein AidB-like acyl-CoA dehydrogenase